MWIIMWMLIRAIFGPLKNQSLHTAIQYCKFVTCTLAVTKTIMATTTTTAAAAAVITTMKAVAVANESV